MENTKPFTPPVDPELERIAALVDSDYGKEKFEDPSHKHLLETFDFRTLVSLFEDEIRPTEDLLSENIAAIQVLSVSGYKDEDSRLQGENVLRALREEKIKALKSVLLEAVDRKIATMTPSDVELLRYDTLQELETTLDQLEEWKAKTEQDIDDMLNTEVRRMYEADDKQVSKPTTNHIRKKRENSMETQARIDRVKNFIEQAAAMSLESVQAKFKEEIDEIRRKDEKAKKGNCLKRLLEKKGTVENCLDQFKVLIEPMKRYSDLSHRLENLRFVVCDNLANDYITNDTMKKRGGGEVKQNHFSNHNFAFARLEASGKIPVSKEQLNRIEQEIKDIEEVPEGFTDLVPQIVKYFYNDGYDDPYNPPVIDGDKERRAVFLEKASALESLYTDNISPVKDDELTQRYVEKLNEYRRTRVTLFSGKARKEQLELELEKLQKELKKKYKDWFLNIIQYNYKMPVDFIDALLHYPFEVIGSELRAALTHRIEMNNKIKDEIETSLDKIRDCEQEKTETVDMIYGYCGVYNGEEYDIPVFPESDLKNNNAIFLDMVRNLANQVYTSEAKKKLNTQMSRTSESLKTRLLQLREQLGNEFGDYFPSVATGLPGDANNTYGANEDSEQIRQEHDGPDAPSGPVGP